MAKKQATKAEREYMNRVAAVGCIACINLGIPDSPTEIHHVMTGTGAGQRAPHTRVLPLCFHHHSAQGVDGIHGGIESWEAVHGTELVLLEQLEGIMA